MFVRFLLFVAWTFFSRVEGGEVHFMSTGEDPKDFVRTRLESHDVSMLNGCLL